MVKANSRVFAVIALCFLFVAALAQTETGQISGKVTDSNGGLLSGAKVTIKSTTTGFERTFVTGSDGFYAVTNLQPGLYSVTVFSKGFTDFVKQADITVGSKVSLNVELRVGQITGDTVEVVAGSGVEVNTVTQELSNIVSSNNIQSLPMQDRNPYALARISGNVASDPNMGGERGVGFSINGMRAASTNVLLDGADNNDTFTASIGQSVPLESVQEFRIITSNFSAEYGRASGGVVNLVTKSGTNKFHGSAFEFNRNSALSSNGYDNNAQGIEKGIYNRNQFGYSIGGPIVKDKLMFYHTTEWTRVRSSAPQILIVPTQELINASSVDTKNFFSNYQTARPINGKIFTVAEVKAAEGLTGAGAFNSLPGTLPAFGLATFAVPADMGGGDPQNTYSTLARVDWNLSEKTQIYGRYARENENFFDGSNNFSNYAGFDTGATNINNNYLLSMTRIISPNLVSQSKVVYNRLDNSQPLGIAPVGPTLYLTGRTNQRLLGERISLPGYSQFTPGNAIPFGGPQNLAQLFQDISWTTGKHQFRFGGQFLYIQDNRAFGAYQNAVEQLGGNVATGLNNFVAGNLNIFQAAVNPQGKFPGDTLTLPVSPPDFTRSNRYNDFGLYFNDSFRVSPRLNLNLGVRYEYFGVQHNVDPNKDSNFYFGLGSSIQERIRNGRVLLTKDSPDGIGGLWAPDKNNFAPRLGFAWDLFGNGKTSLRGGFGIAYERNFGNVTFNVIQNPPNYAVIALLPADVGGVIKITPNNAGPLAGSSGTKVLPSTSTRWVRPDIKNAYSRFYSLSVEHELAARTVLSLEYTGSSGVGLYSLENPNRIGTGLRYLGSLVNRPPAIGGTANRLNGQYTALNARANNGKSRFNSMIASINSSRFGNTGLQVNAKYTFSLSRDNLSTTFSEGQGGNFQLGMLDPYNPDLDYGHSDYDARHRFVSAFSWDVPLAKGMKGVAGHILGGWTLSGIFNVRSGTPFTVYDCSAFDPSISTICMRMVSSAGLITSGTKVTPIADENNRFSYIDLSNQSTSTFTDISGATEVGPFPSNMTSRNLFRGPGNWGIDGGLKKSINLTEKYKVELRADFINMFNHANLYISPGETDLSGSPIIPASKGLTGASETERRNIQISLRFVF